MTADEYPEVARSILGAPGRLIWHSKTVYLEEHPKHRVYFNGSVAVDGVIVWSGDVDLDAKLDADRLEALAIKTGKRVHILPERYKSAPPTREDILAGKVVDAIAVAVTRRSSR